MELRHLRYFTAVADAEHFRIAARRLGIAQPALSRQIQALEREMGLALFERLPRGVKLTDAGRRFLSDVKGILSDLEQAKERATRVALGQVGVLRVSFTEAGSWQGVVPDTIHTFRSSHPDVELVLLPLDSTAQLEGLRADRIDVAFLYELSDTAPEFETRLMQMEDIVIALPASHELASRPQIWLQDLADMPMIWTIRSLNTRFYDAVMAGCLKGGLIPRIVQEVSTGAIVVSLVAVGLGLGLLPSAIRWRLPEGIVLKPIGDLSIPYRIEAAWRRGNRSPILSHFVQIASEMASSSLHLASGCRPLGEPGRADLCERDAVGDRRAGE
jgi:DNA-binding transcriptional LysR family regulator